ncbi:hypothetical protein [Streptomyces sp. NBC_01237]|uniref:hypothetical protein n=1 Tax=Streptomyces sp. NBC_01237 TaxID=2903790 RepID=UPI002DDA6DC0|nr:hypothetical protein [Streptomyces sp. NBC_01237]WRZ77200.1 hypothetical protein OG251_36665 [Streptomyces sp. NBC_01237]
MTPTVPPTATLRCDPAEVPPATTGPQPPYLAAAAEIRARIADGLYTPGARLTMAHLTGCTDHAPADLHKALDHLAHLADIHAVHAVNGRWYVRDDRPSGHTARRAAHLLGTVIGQGAYPPGTRLPVRQVLARILLATPADVTQALNLLADQRVLLPGRARPHVAQPPGGLPPEQWPQRLLAITGQDPTRQQESAPFSRPDIQATLDAALHHWQHGTCLPARDMTLQETLQHDVLARLARNTYRRAATRPLEHSRLRQAAARATACRQLPTVAVPLHERQYRFTVLETALADLAHELTEPTRPGRDPRR